MADVGELEAIWLKRTKKGPMDAVDRVATVAGEGLAGNLDRRRKRQVTLLAAEDWAAAMTETGADLDPALRRANLLVRGVDLKRSVGKTLAVGACRIRIWGETRPCRRMDETLPGLEQALGRDWRGGVYGVVLDDAEIAVGDPVRWREDESDGG